MCSNVVLVIVCSKVVGCDLAALYGVNPRGTHTQLIAYHTIGAWGTGSDDVSLIQSTKAPQRDRDYNTEGLKVNCVKAS